MTEFKDELLKMLDNKIMITKDYIAEQASQFIDTDHLKSKIEAATAEYRLLKSLRRDVENLHSKLQFKNAVKG